MPSSRGRSSHASCTVNRRWSESLCKKNPRESRKGGDMVSAGRNTSGCPWHHKEPQNDEPSADRAPPADAGIAASQNQRAPKHAALLLPPVALRLQECQKKAVYRLVAPLHCQAPPVPAGSGRGDPTHPGSRTPMSRLCQPTPTSASPGTAGKSIRNPEQPHAKGNLLPPWQRATQRSIPASLALTCRCTPCSG